MTLVTLTWNAAFFVLGLNIYFMLMSIRSELRKLVAKK